MCHVYKENANFLIEFSAVQRANLLLVDYVSGGWEIEALGTLNFHFECFPLSPQTLTEVRGSGLKASDQRPCKHLRGHL